MCPDYQILSLYIDGEISSPWKEKTESHLASCEACRSRLDRYRRLHSVLTGAAPQAQDDALKRAQERIWAKLPDSLVKMEEAVYQRSTFSLVKTEKQHKWKRTISLPVPAAAAAAAVFIFAALLAIRGFTVSSQTNPYEQVSGIGVDLQGIVPISDMNGILQYLSSQEGGDYMIIQLPETRNFSSYGEPALIRAADYSAGQSRRRVAAP